MELNKISYFFWDFVGLEPSGTTSQTRVKRVSRIHRPTKSQKRLFRLAARNRLSLSLPLSFSSSSYFLSFSIRKKSVITESVILFQLSLPVATHFYQVSISWKSVCKTSSIVTVLSLNSFCLFKLWEGSITPHMVNWSRHGNSRPGWCLNLRKIHLFAGWAVKRERRKGSSRRQLRLSHQGTQTDLCVLCVQGCRGENFTLDPCLHFWDSDWFGRKTFYFPQSLNGKGCFDHGFIQTQDQWRVKHIER